MLAMARRGLEVVFPADVYGHPDPGRLTGCELVHVYRRVDRGAWGVLRQLARQGVAITYDNDDDFATLPKESPGYKELGGLAGQRMFTQTVKLAKFARVFTTTSEVLANKYRRAGVQRGQCGRQHLLPHAPPAT